MGLEKEGDLVDNPKCPFVSIVAALRPDIGPICALWGHCGLTRGTCCQSIGLAEVIVAQGYTFPLNVFFS